MSSALSEAKSCKISAAVPCNVTPTVAMTAKAPGPFTSAGASIDLRMETT